MRTVLLGALAGALSLFCPAAGTGAEHSRLVRAHIFTSGGVRSFRHQVTVRSKDASRQVLAVLVGELPGLPVKPDSLKVPGGWQGRILERPRPGWLAWAVEVSCIGEEPASEMPAETAEPEGFGLRAGESLTFEFYLPYEAGGLRTEPIFVTFSDGTTGIASR
jgi:hypothetical protein